MHCHLGFDVPPARTESSSTAVEQEHLKELNIFSTKLKNLNIVDGAAISYLLFADDDNRSTFFEEATWQLGYTKCNSVEQSPRASGKCNLKKLSASMVQILTMANQSKQCEVQGPVGKTMSDKLLTLSTMKERESHCGPNIIFQRRFSTCQAL
jgi:hypothetical protein